MQGHFYHLMYLAGLSAPAVARLLLFTHQQSLRDDAMSTRQMDQTHHQLHALQPSLHIIHQPPRLQHRLSRMALSLHPSFRSQTIHARQQSQSVPQTHPQARDLNHPLPVADIHIRLQLVGPIKHNARQAACPSQVELGPTQCAQRHPGGHLRT